MKPFVLKAQTKELYSFIKSVEDLDQKALLEINNRLLKIQIEVNETMHKIM